MNNKTNNHVAPVVTPIVVPVVAPVVEDKDRVKVRWGLAEAVLTATWPDNSTLTFDLGLLFPDFVGLTDAQKLVVANGIHQKLGDSCARPKAEKLTPDNARTTMILTFKGIVDGTAWSRKGGVGNIGIAKQLQEKAALLSEDDRQQMNEMFEKMGMTTRV